MLLSDTICVHSFIQVRYNVRGVTSPLTCDQVFRGRGGGEGRGERGGSKAAEQSGTKFPAASRRQTCQSGVWSLCSSLLNNFCVFLFR